MTEKAKESIGEQLRKARLKKRASIDEVYRETKIHPKILNAMEEDRYDEFLNPTYAKAFLKSYCRYLDVDANKILDGGDSLRKETQKPILEIKSERERSFISNINWQEYIKLAKRWALPIGVGLLGIFLGISLITLTTKAIKKIKYSRPFRPKVRSAGTLSTPAIKTPLSIPKKEPLTLIVKTKGDVWLKVKSDGKTVFQNVLKKESVEAYKAANEFVLWTGKGEYLDLVLNGNPLGSPGKGVIKNINLTHKGLTIKKK
ncbi:MAG: helix-turn-helix domain-containing protein [Candidatus Omnitrophica bacterium]|nr:helix-turn-helix domain-containing protein [Candidatus Omnitrophota bacterium]